MKRLKKFFIYFLLIVGFYIISQILISCIINLRYKNIQATAKDGNTIVVVAEASQIDGIANCKVINLQAEPMENKYLKVDCYSKDNILLGTKYIEMGRIGAKDKKEYEVRFNYKKVKRVETEIVDEIPKSISEEDKKSDEKQKGIMLLTAVTFLCFL